MADGQQQPAPVHAPAPVPGIKPPQPLILEGSVSEAWKSFKQKWNNYAIITNLNAHNREYQVALFLHTLGDQALKIYDGFTFATPADQRTVAEIIDKFDAFAVGEINETYERFIFNKRCQQEGESFECFLAAIRTLVKTCNYCQNCLDSILRDRIVVGIRDSETQQTLLREDKLTLEKCVTICKAAENASIQYKALRPDSVNKVSRNGTRHRRKSTKTHAKESAKVKGPSQEKECLFCGLNHVLKKKLCPAWGKTCTTCHQQNHYAVKCPQKSKQTYKKTYQVDAASSEEEWVNLVEHNKTMKDIKCKMLLGDQEVVFQIDTGASLNLLPAKYATNVSPTAKKLRMWNDSELTPLGTSRVSIRNPKNRKKYSIEFTIVSENLTPLIGYRAAEQMGLLTVNAENFDRISTVSVLNLDDYQDVFNGKLGTLPGEVSLKTDESIRPVIMPSRRVPLALRPKLKEELDKMTESGVIMPIDEPTQWLSQLVITQKKTGDLRVCIDPRELNRALLREHYILPVLDDTLHELSNSKVFTKADLSSGYWHIQLDEPSSLLTTFQTCFGRYRWLRLPFGTKVSAEIFQKKIFEALSDLPGVACIADDVIIHGKNEQEHEENLKKFLSRCRDKGIKLNKKKLDLRMSEITFMGHRISQNGIQSDPEKVRALQEMESPKNLSELRRFLGLANYLSKFLPNLTETSTPLRNLTRKNVPWVWSEAQQKAFDSIKQQASASPILAIYKPDKELVLENDASEYGLGSALLQSGQPIGYASRSLTDTERRWAQIEKELLAVVFGLEKFEHYTYGRHVSVITDHQPLVSIVQKPLAAAPKRLQSLLLRAQKFNFTLSYKPGTAIPLADTLSRAPLSEKPSTDLIPVNSVDFLPVKSSCLQMIRDETLKDNSLTTLKTIITSGWPQSKSSLPMSVAPYFDYRDELTIQDGIILRGERIVIPHKARAEMKKKIHAGHMGINSCLRRAREVIFWPGMSSEIRQLIESCDICATFADRQSPETLSLHPVPERPWDKVGTDLFTIHGRDYLITVDYFSGYFEVDYLPDTASETVISKLKQHFARYGVPSVLISDNGPQYTSGKFHQFSVLWDFNHQRISPGNSKANGCAEAAVKTAKRLMKKCAAGKEDPYLGLLNLRNTPSEGLNKSPAQRLLGRVTNSPLPSVQTRSTDFDQDIKLKEEQKRRSAERLDEHRYDLKPLNMGQNVRLQPIQTGKKTWEPATVTKKLHNRSYEVTTHSGRKLRRNRQFIRPSQASNIPIDYTPHVHNSPSTTSVSTTNNNLQQPQNHDAIPKLEQPQHAQGRYVTRSGRTVKPVQRLSL